MAASSVNWETSPYCLPSSREGRADHLSIRRIDLDSQLSEQLRALSPFGWLIPRGPVRCNEPGSSWALRAWSRELVIGFFDYIIDQLCSGRRVNLPGVGTLYLVDVGAARAQNPRTLERIQTPPKTVVRFRVSDALRARIEAWDSQGEPRPDQQSPRFEEWSAGRVPLARFGYRAYGQKPSSTSSTNARAPERLTVTSVDEESTSPLRIAGWDALRRITNESGKPVEIRPSNTQLDRIVGWLCARGGLDRPVVEIALHLLLDGIAALLVTSNRLEFREYFVFESRLRAPRTVPALSGGTGSVPARRTIRFKPGRTLAWRANDVVELQGWRTDHGLDASCTKLAVRNGADLTDLTELADLTGLTLLYVANAGSLRSLDGLETLTSLKSLTVTDCSALTGVGALRSHPSLKAIKLSGCSSLTTLQGIEGCSALEDLNLSGCSSLTDLGALKAFPSLKALRLSDCSSLTTLQGIEGCPSLGSLRLIGCSSLTDLGALQALESLKTLDLSWCSSLTTLQGIGGCSSLGNLQLTRCSSLTDLRALHTLTSLVYLNLEGCSSLPEEMQKAFGSFAWQTPMEQFRAAFNENQG
jgi:nucleoid DNA-binding protein